MFCNNVNISKCVRYICCSGMELNKEMKVYVDRMIYMCNIIEFKVRRSIVNGFVV